MTLREKVEQDLVVAMKSRDAEKVSVLRFLLSAVKYKEVDTKSRLTDEQVIEVLAKQVKTHKESVEAFRNGGREELASKEESELKILQNYLPAQMSEAEVRRQVIESLSQIKNEGKTVDFGSLMKASMLVLKGQALRLHSGQADGSVVKKIVEEVLKSVAV